MLQYDPRFDDYISRSADFAKPILTHLREVVHAASPLLGETMKWSFPHFDYKGPVCSMAGFKQHCVFGFWKSSLMDDPHQIMKPGEATAGSFGRLTSVADLPADDILIQYILEAIELNEKGIKLEKEKPAIKTELVVPDYFIAFLAQHANAVPQFERFSYSQKKEYVEWITDAKTETTRLKRMETAAEWIAEGKSRHWKYK